MFETVDNSCTNGHQTMTTAECLTFPSLSGGSGGLDKLEDP